MPDARTLLDEIRPRIGVFYTDPEKDKEIQSRINGAIGYFGGAGWKIDPDAPTPLAVEAIELYCKMSQSTDPAVLINHPVLVSFVSQGRSGRDKV